jgi:hypothetical protein
LVVAALAIQQVTATVLLAPTAVLLVLLHRAAVAVVVIKRAV